MSDQSTWVQRTSPSTVVVRRGTRIVLSLIDDGEVERLARALLATAPTFPSTEAMEESRRISAECWQELSGYIIASHSGYGQESDREPWAGPEEILAYVDELRLRISKPIADELRALDRESGDIQPGADACSVPPSGWWCSREAGHDGACAARPVPHDSQSEVQS